MLIQTVLALLVGGHFHRNPTRAQACCSGDAEKLMAYLNALYLPCGIQAAQPRLSVRGRAAGTVHGDRSYQFQT